MIDKKKTPMENFLYIERSIIAFIMFFVSAPCAIFGFYSSHIVTVFGIFMAMGYSQGKTSWLFHDDSQVTKFFRAIYENSFGIWHFRLLDLITDKLANHAYLQTVLKMQVDTTNSFFQSFTYNGVVMLAVFAVSFLVGYLRRELRKRDKGKK